MSEVPVRICGKKDCDKTFENTPHGATKAQQEGWTQVGYTAYCPKHSPREKVARIHKSSERLKLEFRVVDAPFLRKDSETIQPKKVVFVDYGEKSQLVITGTAANNRLPRTMYFNVSNTKYPDPPEWLVKIFNEAMSKYTGSNSGR